MVTTLFLVICFVTGVDDVAAKRVLVASVRGLVYTTTSFFRLLTTTKKESKIIAMAIIIYRAISLFFLVKNNENYIQPVLANLGMSRLF